MNKIKSQLTEQFLRLETLIFRHRMRTQAKDSSQMNPNKGQGRVLAILKLQPEIGQKELGYLLDMSKQALAGLIGKLERNGCVTRTQSEKDHRAYIIKLTDTGREALPDENTETDEINEFELILDCFNDEEQHELSGFLNRIIAAFEKKYADTGEYDFAELFREKFFSKHKHSLDGAPWFIRRKFMERGNENDSK
jgi:DNA-binding MarR family transcriptional regulator